ncbi:FtsX-like permease family protein [Thermobifida halotolerans]|uniref:FtsX-like permease family protein n=1 Tax=Thermobifida halotolerans TaxID=483545 RepID=A0A399G9Z7_9ACTN|nr:ABC transporter permease [Thermobifida halotolerans]UOE21620.1 FtsX-like permease family protein [Thermobifida halotolerans]
MLRTTLAGLRASLGRLTATVLAIVMGVVFTTGTLVFGDTLGESFAVQAMGSMDRVDVIAFPADEPSEEGEEAEPALLDDAALREVRDLPEVAAATGVVMASAPLLDTDGQAVGSVPTLGVSVGGDVARYEAAEGRLPEADDEAALATVTARQSGFGVGDTVTVVDPDGDKHEFTVTGLINFGLSMQISYRGAVAFTLDVAERMTGAPGYAEIHVRAAEGVSAAEAESAVAAALGDDAEVLTGQEYGEELAASAGAQAEVFTTALLLFAAVAVFVSALVINNTFAILVAQRQREMALLRCVGATRGQVFRSVLLEALVVGLLASAVGVAVGIGLGWAGFVVGARFLDAASSGAPVVTVTPIVVGMLVGTLVSLVSALLPALRATRVAPLAALRTSALTEEPNRRTGWIRTAVGTLFLLASAAMLTAALTGPPSQSGMVLVVASGMVCFVGVVAFAPLLVRGVVAVLGWPVRRVGAPGSLAVDNALRAPRRAAAAMIALTVGATLITGYSVISASMRDTLEARLDEQFPIDYRISTQWDPDAADEATALPSSVVADLESSPAIGRVFTERTAADDEGVFVTAYPGARLGVDVGGDVDDVAPGSVAVTETVAERLGVDLGDPVPLRTAAGELSPTVVAIVADGGVMYGVVASVEDFERLFPDVPDTVAYVKAAEDASLKETTDAIDAAVADHPTLQVSSAAETKSEFEEMLNQMFLAVLALLGLAIVIAVFGVANTMALSVLERRRESALLRALGLTRPQLRRMLAVEAVLISVTGGALGVALGLLFGWAAGSVTLRGLIFSPPTAEIAGLLAVTVLAGLLASVLPARRASRVSITAELADQ